MGRSSPNFDFVCVFLYMSQMLFGQSNFPLDFCLYNYDNYKLDMNCDFPSNNNIWARFSEFLCLPF